MLQTSATTAHILHNSALVMPARPSFLLTVASSKHCNKLLTRCWLGCRLPAAQERQAARLPRRAGKAAACAGSGEQRRSFSARCSADAATLAVPECDMLALTQAQPQRGGRKEVGAMVRRKLRLSSQGRFSAVTSPCIGSPASTCHCRISDGGCCGQASNTCRRTGTKSRRTTLTAGSPQGR